MQKSVSIGAAAGALAFLFRKKQQAVKIRVDAVIPLMLLPTQFLLAA
jgi:hypothetical protein